MTGEKPDKANVSYPVVSRTPASSLLPTHHDYSKGSLLKPVAGVPLTVERSVAGVPFTVERSVAGVPLTVERSVAGVPLTVERSVAGDLPSNGASHPSNGGVHRRPLPLGAC